MKERQDPPYQSPSDNEDDDDRSLTSLDPESESPGSERDSEHDSEHGDKSTNKEHPVIHIDLVDGGGGHDKRCKIKQEREAVRPLQRQRNTREDRPDSKSRGWGKHHEKRVVGAWEETWVERGKRKVLDISRVTCKVCRREFQCKKSDGTASYGHWGTHVST